MAAYVGVKAKMRGATAFCPKKYIHIPQVDSSKNVTI